MKQRPPLITAHTGCEGSPVNTVASMLQGIRSGADAVEIDIRSTRDGAVILMHDSFVMTQAGKRILLDSLSLEELLELEKNGEILCGHPKMRITGLEEALEVARGHRSTLNLDLKDDRSIVMLCKAVRRFGMLERTIVTGCNCLRAIKVKEECKELQVLLNVSEKQPAGDAGPERTVQAICRQAVSACCCGINIDFSICSEQLVDYTRRRYLPVAVWTVDGTEDMQSMIAMGVHSITTYEPTRLRRLERQYCSAHAR